MTKQENEERLARLKNIVLSMPEKPGSYQYYDENHTIIYVGKAKNLKRSNFLLFQFLYLLEDISYTLCLFRVACLGKMLFGRSKIAFLQIGAGGIEIRCLIIWEEADGNVEYLVKLWRTRLVSLCHQEHLLQRKSFMVTCFTCLMASSLVLTVPLRG